MTSFHHIEVPSINDPNSGFKLVSTAVSEQDLADISSLYSEPTYESGLKVSGSVRFAVWYRTDEKILYVKIVNASGLAVAKGESLNPYIKVYLLPDQSKHTKRKTGIQRKTTNPEFNEVVKYKVTREELNTATLWLSVWDWDTMGRNRFLGEVTLALFNKNFDLSSSRIIKYPLKEHEDVEETNFLPPPGKLCMALKYEFLGITEDIRRSKSLTPETHTSLNSSRTHSVSPEQSIKSLKSPNYLEMPDSHFGRASLPLSVSNSCANIDISKTTGRLLIRIRNAQDLPPVDSTGDTNPFVRCYLLPSENIKRKRKTSVIPKSLDPVWEEEHSYNMIKMNELQSQHVLEVSVWDNDRRGSNSFIGGLRLGPALSDDSEGPGWMDSREEEVSHWEEMLANTDVWVERTHELRPSMASRRPKKAVYEQQDSDEAPEAKDEDIANSEDSHSVGTELSVSRRIKGDHYQISGEIVLDLIYLDKILTVKVFRAQGLAAVSKSLSDPYVKLYLLPDMSSKKKTQIRRKTLDPSFDQFFTYKLEDLTKHTVWVTVWNHEGIFQHNEFLGEVCIPLESHKFESTLREVTYKLCDYSLSADQNLTHGDSAVYQLPSGVSKGDVAVLHDSSSNLISGGEKPTTVIDEPSTTPAAEQEPLSAITESAERAEITEPVNAENSEEKSTTPSVSMDNENSSAGGVQSSNTPPKATPTKKTPKSGDNKKRASPAKKRHHNPAKVVMTISASTRPSKARKKIHENIL